MTTIAAYSHRTPVPMLTHLVRPLVRTQVQVLANSEKAGGQMVATIARWLGYLGVRAEVDRLQAQGDRIQVSLFVGKPEQCTEDEWERILDKLSTSDPVPAAVNELAYADMTEAQQRQAARLLAHIIQVGNPNAMAQWDDLRSQLVGLAMETELLQSIYAAIKVPQFLDSLLKDIEPDVAAFVLTRAIGIALIDKTISLDEDSALKSIYSALGSSSRA